MKHAASYDIFENECVSYPFGKIYFQVTVTNDKSAWLSSVRTVRRQVHSIKNVTLMISCLLLNFLK